MFLTHLKCMLMKRDARVTGIKWELFQQARTAESHTCHTHIEMSVSHNLMLEHYFKIACDV